MRDFTGWIEENRDAIGNAGANACTDFIKRGERPTIAAAGCLLMAALCAHRLGLTLEEFAQVTGYFFYSAKEYAFDSGDSVDAP